MSKWRNQQERMKLAAKVGVMTGVRFIVQFGNNGFKPLNKNIN